MSELDTATTRPMRADARRNRERIMDAARELFASESPDVGVEDLARRAGVGVGTVYRHFPDKHAVMGALVRERFELFNERLRAAIADEQGEPFAVLCEVLRDNLCSIAADAATRYALMSGGEPVFAYAAAEAQEFIALSRVLVARAHASGTLRAEFQAEQIPMVMCGVCATIDNHKAGWDWRWLLEIVLSGLERRELSTRRSAA